MTLVEMINKRKTVKGASDKAAKVIKEKDMSPSLAGLATLSLAKSLNEQVAFHDWWRIIYANRYPAEVSYCPPVTLAEILSWEPDAITAEPFEPTWLQRNGPSALFDETGMPSWLCPDSEHEN